MLLYLMLRNTFVGSLIECYEFLFLNSNACCIITSKTQATYEVFRVNIFVNNNDKNQTLIEFAYKYVMKLL